MIHPVLISSFVGFGVFFVGKFIGKKFNLSANSYLGFAIISFVLALICHAKIQDALLKLFANFLFIDRTTIIRSVIGLCVIYLLSIFLVEGRKKTIPSPTNKIELVSSTHAREIYSYLDVLYNDVGLFIQQYYDSKNSHNNQKTKTLNEKMRAVRVEFLKDI